MKKTFALITILLQTVICSAQMDIGLQRLVQKAQTEASAQMVSSRGRLSEQPVRVIVQMKSDATLSQIRDVLISNGAAIVADYGRIGILNVPVSRLQAVSGLDEIESLNTDRKVRMDNDLARADLQVDTVQNIGLAYEYGLDSIYDGTGVLIGVVDVGIDFNHAAFRDRDGKTRISMAQIYDCNEDGEPVDMAVVRQTFTTPEEIGQLTSDGGSQSHGSHTSCTAAGSPVSIGDSLVIQGMAPGAGLLLSSLYNADDNYYDSYLMDGIYSQMKYAEEMHKPIVINISFSDLTVFRDGKSPFDVFCESMTGPGRIICFSTGNDANSQYALEFTPQNDSDTLRTILYDIGNFYHKGLHCMIAGDDDTPFQVRLGCFDMFTNRELPFEYFSLDGKPVTEQDIVFCGNDESHDNRFVADIDIPEGYVIDMTYPYFIYVEVIGRQGCGFRIATDKINLMGPELSGNGRFTSGSGKNSYSIYCETDSAISVGSYVSRQSYINSKGRTLNAGNSLQNPSTFSSYGTTISGKSIPDVLAPGEFLLSAYNAYDKTNVSQETGMATGNNVFGYSDAFGRRSWYGWMNGTSMSSPAVTGVIALWLQADPNLGPAAVRQVLRESSLVTPELENGYQPSVYGCGLLRAAEGLRYIEEKRRGGTDGIVIPESPDSPMRIYNLSGQPVEQPAPGSISIIGSRKILH